MDPSYDFLRFLRLSRNITILTRWFFSRDFLSKNDSDHPMWFRESDIFSKNQKRKNSAGYFARFLSDNFKIISVNPFSLRDQNRRHQSLWFSYSGLWLVLWYHAVLIWDSQQLLIGGWLLELRKSVGQN